MVGFKKHDTLRDDLDIVIRGRDANLLFDPMLDFELLCGDYKLETFGREEGSICLIPDAHASLRGRVYRCVLSPEDALTSCESFLPRHVHLPPASSRNLFVNVSAEIKHLRVVVSVQNQQMRDRHILPSDLPKLVADVLRGLLPSLRTMQEQMSAATNVFNFLLEGLRAPERYYLYSLKTALQPFLFRSML